VRDPLYSFNSLPGLTPRRHSVSFLAVLDQFVG
jgi:hypothetical protein